VRGSRALSAEADTKFVALLPCDPANTFRAKIVETQIEPIRSINLKREIEACAPTVQVGDNTIDRRRLILETDLGALIHSGSRESPFFLHSGPFPAQGRGRV